MHDGVNMTVTISSAELIVTVILKKDK